MISCNSYNFSEAQPVDKENIYEFPASFRGTWIENDQTVMLTPANGIDAQNYGGGPSVTAPLSKALLQQATFNQTDSAWYFIEKNYALVIFHCKEKIAMGAWPKLDDKGKLFFEPTDHAFKKIEYDSLLNPIDTISNYVIRENKIYEISEEPFLEKGYPFFYENDTIVVLKYDTISVDLGQNAFLRKLNDSFYVLNIRNTILGEQSSWWRLIILQQHRDQSIGLWECDSKSGELPSMFFSRSIKRDIFYFDSKWSAEEMLDLIEKGYFSISSTLVKK